MELNFFYDNLYTIPGIAFIVTVIFKGIVIKIKHGKINLADALGSGGMPSAHSSVITSVATAIAIKHGANSDMFAIALTLAIIIIYDAVNVRYQAGLHGKALNKILGKEKYKVSLGHLPSEAFAGSIVGILVAIILYFI